MRTQTDLVLVKLIQIGDGIETASGICPARTTMQERFGTCYYHACVSVWVDKFGIPVFSNSILAVWRNGVCIWRRGESLVQKSLFALEAQKVGS